MRDRCLSAPQRGRELNALVKERSEFVRKGRDAQVPEIFHAALRSLGASARLPKGVRVELVGRQWSDAASALDDGTITLGSRLWDGPQALDAEEAAAIVAHELAHLENGDAKRRLCDAVAMGGDESVAFASAIGAERRAIWAGSDDMAVEMMRANHRRELEADMRAVDMLLRMGVAPEAFGRMLLKLSSAGAGGYSGTHPPLETRLENLGLSLVQ